MTYPLQLLVWQADTILHAHLVVDTALLTQNGYSLHLDAILDYARGMAVRRRWRALHTGPCTDLAAPTHDGVQNAGIMLNFGVLQNDRLFHTSTTTDSGARPDGYVGAQLGGRIDVCSGVNEDGRDDVGRGSGELLGSVLPGLLEVQSVGGDGRASSLDLAPKVLGLVYKELLAVGHVAEDILLQANNWVAAIVVLVLVVDKGTFEIFGTGVTGQSGTVVAAFDRALDRGEDDIGAEQVDTAVDQVADVALRLLNIMQDALGVAVANNATEVCGGVIVDLCTQDDGLGILLGVELEHLVERE